MSTRFSPCQNGWLPRGMIFGYARLAFIEDRFAAVGVDFHTVGVPFDFDKFHANIDNQVRIKNPFESALRVVRDGIMARCRRVV